MQDVIVIGGGPAGMTAAIYSARAGFKTLLIEAGAPGGQAALTDIIENYPGFPGGISGPDLMMKFFEQAQSLGVEMQFKNVDDMDLTNQVKKVRAGDQEYKAKAVIIASGARPRVLGVEGEERFRGKGVSYCGTCDGYFFKDKEIAVIGGGDTAVEEALFLAKICKKVTVIHRRDKLRAAKILQERALKNEKIEFIWDSVVDRINGTEKIEELVLHNVKTQELSKLGVEGVFIFVGYLPNSDFLPKELSCDEKGYLLTDDELNTNIPGVFAVGDVRKKKLRQVATAVGDGATVITALEKYLAV